MVDLYIIIGIMILSAIIALEVRDLISSIICAGVCGFALVFVFLRLHAPDLAVVQMIVETLSLIILIAAILRTTREDVQEGISFNKVILYLGGLFFVIIFMIFAYNVISDMAKFGEPYLRMSYPYIEQGVRSLFNGGPKVANIVGAVLLDFRGYDALGCATVLFASAIGVLVVLRKIGRKKDV